jgi:hypothetical protein
VIFGLDRKLVVVIAFFIESEGALAAVVVVAALRVISVGIRARLHPPTDGQ